MTADRTSTRVVNRRGEGAALRAEITGAAARLLSRSTTRDAVTLRAIAREAGIAAPSIYPHFRDREAVLDAVVEAAFEHLGARCAAAARSRSAAPEAFEAVCRAYVAFAHDHPGEYRILFERPPAAADAPEPRTYASGLAAFAILQGALQRMADEGATGIDPALDAQVVWATLHGLATLVPSNPGFPWASTDRLITWTTEALSARVAT